MNYKGKRIKIINTEGFYKDKFNNLEKYIGQTGIIKYDYDDFRYRFLINFDNNELENIDQKNGRLNFQISNIEFIDDTYVKPPLGVTPKHIFEIQRIQELTRALYEYAKYNPSDMNYNSMLEWTKELFERLENQFIKK